MKRRIKERLWVVAAVVTSVGVVATSPVLTPAARATPAQGSTVHVTIKDFKVKASRWTVPAGTITLRVHNAGPSTHEFNVDRTDDDPAALPLTRDGLSVNEDDPSLHRIGSIEEVFLGDTSDLTLKLAPGHYVLYCNLEGHYLGGMHWSLDVAGDHG